MSAEGSSPTGNVGLFIFPVPARSTPVRGISELTKGFNGIFPDIGQLVQQVCALGHEGIYNMH
jgi:hypothetical protein